MTLAEQIKQHAVYVESHQMEMVPLSVVLTAINDVDLVNQTNELIDRLDSQLEDVRKTLNTITFND